MEVCLLSLYSFLNITDFSDKNKSNLLFWNFPLYKMLSQKRNTFCLSLTQSDFIADKKETSKWVHMTEQNEV